MLRCRNPLIPPVSTEPAALPDEKNPAPNYKVYFQALPKQYESIGGPILPDFCYRKYSIKFPRVRQ
jgi:hypothetical protein